MSFLRSGVVLVAAVLVAATAATDPAHATTDPTTLAVDGTVRVIVIDHFGADGHAEQLTAIETDDGSQIPVDLPGEAPANARFTGELIVRGDVASDLAAKDLLPKSGSTIDEDTRAGRVAVASAEQQDAPLQVAESSVVPVKTAAVTTPAAHRAYVAVMDGRGSIEESDAAIQTLVGSITSYWQTESSGAITSFPIEPLQHFTTTAAGTEAQSCGMATDPGPVWTEAAKKFPNVSFSRASGNHLIVAMANECSGSGVAGIAEVGSDLSSGGRLSLSMGTIAKQVGTHEMGHTFGLDHANLQRCATCGVTEYQDVFSVMGLAIKSSTAFTPPALDVAYRLRLGTVAAGEVSQISSADGIVTRTVRLAPRPGTTGTRGLDVVDPSSGAHYLVEYRSGTARDAAAFYKYSGEIGGVTYRPGITVTTAQPVGTLTLLAPTTNTGSLTTGQAFTSSTGTVQVAVGAMDSTSGYPGADVTITFGTPPPAAAPPAAAPAPLRIAAKTPRITGTVKVGRTLKVKVGAWSPRPSYRYQWYAGGHRITSKGTKSSFKLTSKQKGKKISVKVTARKAGYATVTKTSKSTKRVVKR